MKQTLTILSILISFASYGQVIRQSKTIRVAGSGGSGTTDTALIKSLISDSTKRFGIQDNLGRQDRSVDMEGYNFIYSNSGIFEINGLNGGYGLGDGYNYLYNTVNDGDTSWTSGVNTQAIPNSTVTKISSSVSALSGNVSELSLETTPYKAFARLNNQSGVRKIEFPFIGVPINSTKFSAISVQVNGTEVFANDSGRVDLGTISGGGASKFGKPSEDTLATANRRFNVNANDFEISGVNVFSDTQYIKFDRTNGIEIGGGYLGGGTTKLSIYQSTSSLTSTDGINSANVTVNGGTVDLGSTSKRITATVDSLNAPQNMLYIDAANRIWKAAVPTGSSISILSDATNADFTMPVNGNKFLPSATLTADRTITIPTGTNGDVMIITNNETGFRWLISGSIYLSDRTTLVTELLANTSYRIERISNLWQITN